jgi:hypothetical protein
MSRVGDAEFVAGLGCRGHPTWGEAANWARILSGDITAGRYPALCGSTGREIVMSLLQRTGPVCKTEGTIPTANNAY